MKLLFFVDNILLGLYFPDLQERAMMVRDEEDVPEQAKGSPFAPRLGRRRKLLPFAPRLGREVAPLPQDRFERSASDESSKAH